MPRSTMGGDDPAHYLPKEEKIELEKKLRDEARKFMKSKKTNNKLLSRARNVSRSPSRKADHH